MALTVDEIIAAIYPEFAASESKDTIVALAADNVNRQFFGADYTKAVAYRACHIFFKTSGDSDGAAALASLSPGDITGVHEGGLSVSFAAPSDDGSDYATSKYGKMYLSLLRSRPRVDVNRSPLPYEPF